MASLLVIDIQPAYRAQADFVAARAARWIREKAESYNRVCVMSVNEELSGDTRFDVVSYWEQAGLAPEQFEEHTYIEKSYAFLRGWMDNGVADEHIVATLKKLRQAGEWDSRMLDRTVLSELDDELPSLLDPLSRPDELEAYAAMFKADSWEVCGGGRYECLKEIELWLDSLDVKHSRREELIYG